ncbi:hypothetical protein TNCV_3800731 [Trichonephila clavipes]|nr:hypothetical protein TNCV_3800731 [Trichonephila clavipes]
MVYGTPVSSAEHLTACIVAAVGEVRDTLCIFANLQRRDPCGDVRAPHHFDDFHILPSGPRTVGKPEHRRMHPETERERQIKEEDRKNDDCSCRDLCRLLASVPRLLPFGSPSTMDYNCVECATHLSLYLLAGYV